MTIAEVVKNNDVLLGAEQFDAGVRTDIAGSTGDKNHGATLVGGNMYFTGRRLFIIGTPVARKTR